MKLKSFEISYPGGRKVLLKAKSRRTLDRRLSPDTLNNALIRQVQGADARKVKTW